jgi:hypothetical protein
MIFLVEMAKIFVRLREFFFFTAYTKIIVLPLMQAMDQSTNHIVLGVRRAI